ATGAYVRHPAGADPLLEAGDVLVLAPVDGDQRRRQAVRLDRAPVVRADPLAGGDTVLELHWAADDALEVPLPVATRSAGGSAARGRWRTSPSPSTPRRSPVSRSRRSRSPTTSPIARASRSPEWRGRTRTSTRAAPQSPCSPIRAGRARRSRSTTGSARGRPA